MRNVISAVFVFVVIFSASVSCAGGWYKTKWGMSKNEIEKNVGYTLSPVTETLANQKIDYEITNFLVGNKPCTVKLCIPENKLSFVIVRVEKPNYGDFLELYNMLVGKYGKPSTPRTESKERRGFSARAEWVTDDTIVKLYYADVILENTIERFANVQYMPRSLSGADRL